MFYFCVKYLDKKKECPDKLNYYATYMQVVKTLFGSFLTFCEKRCYMDEFKRSWKNRCNHHVIKTRTY